MKGSAQVYRLESQLCVLLEAISDMLLSLSEPQVPDSNTSVIGLAGETTQVKYKTGQAQCLAQSGCLVNAPVSPKKGLEPLF